MTGSGLTWDDPVLISGASGSVSLSLPSNTFIVLRWDGPYVDATALRIQEASLGVQTGFYIQGPADMTASAGDPGQQSADLSLDANTGARVIAGTPLYLRVYAQNSLEATFTWSTTSILGRAWDIPILFDGASGSLPFDFVNNQALIAKWDGPHADYSIFHFIPAGPGYIQRTIVKTPPADPAARASVRGTDYVFSLGTDLYYEDPGVPIYLQLVPYATGSGTLGWEALGPFPPRPYTWERAEDLDPQITAAPPLTLSVEYDNVGPLYGERHFTFQPPAGYHVTINEFPQGQYLEVYEATTDSFAGTYYGFAANNADGTLDPFNLDSDGTRLHIVVYLPSTMATDGSETAHFELTIEAPEPPPAYQVINDDFASPFPLSLTADGSLTYDNTGATEPPAGTLPSPVYSDKRDIWYIANARSSRRIYKFTTTPSDSDSARQVDMAVWQRLAGGGWTNTPNSSIGRDANTLWVVVPADCEIVLRLSFPYGNQGRWETAGTLAWQDVTATVPANVDPAAPEPLGYSSSVPELLLGSLRLTRYYSIVSDGLPINIYQGSNDPDNPGASGGVHITAPSGDISVASRYPGSPDSFTQVAAPAGTVLTVAVTSSGSPVSLTYGVSTEEDRHWTSWFDTYSPAVDANGYVTQGPYYWSGYGTGKPQTKSWSLSGARSEKPDVVTGDIYTGSYAALQAGALTDAKGSAAPAVAGPVNNYPPNYADLSTNWSANGHLWHDPADDRTDTAAGFGAGFQAITFDQCFDSTGRFLAADMDRYLPLTRFWAQLREQLRDPSAWPTTPSSNSYLTAIQEGRLDVEWSQEPGHSDYPFVPLLTCTATVRVHATASGPNSTLSGEFGLGTATDFGSGETLSVQTFTTEAGADQFALSPNLGGGQVVHTLGFQADIDYSAPATTFELDLVSQPHSWFVFSSVGSLFETPVDAQGLADYAVAHGWGYFGLYGPTWGIAGYGNVRVALELRFPTQFRVGEYAPRFGPPPVPELPQAGTLLAAAPNLSGAADGARVVFS